MLKNAQPSFLTINGQFLQRKKSMEKYIITVDTGGTYTDAVLLDTHSSAIIATAKRKSLYRSSSIGNIARTILPKVAKNLKATIFSPEHRDVGNGVGTAMTWQKKYFKLTL